MEERELYKDLYAELEKYENRGVATRLNNQPASPYADCYGTYGKKRKMPDKERDYVWDDKGR